MGGDPPAGSYETEEKIPLGTDQNGKIEEDNTCENPKVTTKTADYMVLQGDIQQNATQFFVQCKECPFLYLATIYRCRYCGVERHDIEQLTED